MNKWSLTLFRTGCVAFLPLALVYGGGFPIRQGVVLGLLMAWLAFLISKPAVKPARFIPYWVLVSPNWHRILTDFRLISSPEEWWSILESLESSAEYSVLRDGVLFTVVQRSEGSAHTLIFWNQHQAFGSTFQFGEDMTPIQFESPVLEGEHLPARFFMNPYTLEKGVAGHSLGIAVRDWWWEQMKASCAAPLAVDTNPLTGTVELTLATLPLAEFDVYWDQVERTEEYVEFLLKTGPQIRNEHREKLGWKDKTSSYEPGLGIRVPVSIEHKYFSVEHRDI